MPSLKDIRKRIGSVRNTQKITRAMKMVAAAKLRRAQDAVVASRPYSEKLLEMIDSLRERVDIDAHPLLRPHETSQRAIVLALTGDRGLCGAYNSNINRAVLKFHQERQTAYEDLELLVIGRRGRDFFRRRNLPIKDFIAGAWSRNAADVASELSNRLIESYLTGEVDEVFIAYTKFRSAVSQQVVIGKLLPLQEITSLGAFGEEEELAAKARGPEETVATPPQEYIYEPSERALLDMLLPRYLLVQVQRALLESEASEHGSRMTAMENATKNAGEMISSLTLQYNRARQAAITKELIEIISGASNV